MAKKQKKKSIIEICPIRNVVARFGNKWALLVILILSENGCTRFNRLGKLIPDISPKMLARTLHMLEADGLVRRTVFNHAQTKKDPGRHSQYVGGWRSGQAHCFSRSANTGGV